MALRITLPEACLLYLLDRGDLREDDPAAQEATQDRIAQVLGVRRPHVSRAMGRLRGRGLLTTAKVHVAGQDRRRLAYFLTEAGLRKAQALRRKVEDQRLPVIDLQGHQAERRLYEVALLLPRRPRLSDLVSNVRGGRLDLRQFLERQARLKAGKVFDVPAATPGHFRGRKAEVERLAAFLEDPAARGLLLIGLPGIGKTALASEWVAGLKGTIHILWRRISHEATPADLLRDIAGLLSGAGRPAVGDYLQRPREGGRELPLSLLRRDIAEAPSLFVLDDAHAASREVGLFLGDLLRLDAPPGALKVLLLSRERVPYVRPGDFARNRVWELELEDLARPDALSVLEALGTPETRHNEILDRCGGHPLSLELAAAGRIPLAGVRRTSAAWLAEEALSLLDAKSRRALAIASVFEGVAPGGALGAGGRTLARLCLVREVQEDRIVVHDLVREAVLNSLTPQRRRALDREAARILAESGNPADTVSAVRHFLRGRAFDRASALAIERDEEVIGGGLAGSLLSILEPALWAPAGRPLPPRLHLVRGESLFALGRLAEASKAFEAASRARDPLTAAEARLGQGKAESQRRSASALPLLLDARDRLEGLGVLRLLAEAQYWIGGVYEDAARIEEAREAFERGRAISFDVGDRRWEGLCTYGLGRLRSAQRDFIGAVDLEREAVRLLERGGLRLDIAKVCAGLGGDLLELGKYAEAVSYLNRAATEARTTGATGVFAASLYNLASVRLESGDSTGGGLLFEEALVAYEVLEEYDSAASCCAWIGHAALARGQHEISSRYFLRAEDFIARTREPGLRIMPLRHLGRAWRKVGRLGDARAYFERALKDARKAGLARLEEEVTNELRKLS